MPSSIPDKLTCLYGPEPIPGCYEWLQDELDRLREAGLNEAYRNGYRDAALIAFKAIKSGTENAQQDMLLMFGQIAGDA